MTQLTSLSVLPYLIRQPLTIYPTPLPICSHRWTQTASNLQDLYDKLIGDVLIASGVIAYLGAFTSAFRGEVVQEWTLKCKVGLMGGAGGGAVI